MKTSALGLWLACMITSVLAGCGSEGTGWTKPKRDFKQFQAEVFPVLLRDCAFSTCHGSPDRFFRVWGPGRTRLNPMTLAYDPLTGDEASQTYQHALSVVDDAHPSRSLILRKPLAVEAGGSGHLGADKFGRNVYRTVNDAGYLTLSRWALTIPAPPAMQAPATMQTPPTMQAPAVH